MNEGHDVLVVYGLVLICIFLFVLYAHIFRKYQKYRKYSFKDKKVLHIGFSGIFILSLIINYTFLYIVDAIFQNGLLSIEQYNFSFDSFLGISKSDFAIIVLPIIAGIMFGPKKTILDY